MMRRTVGSAALLAGLSAVVLAGCTSATTAPQRTPAAPAVAAMRYSTTPRVSDGRFTAPYELDGGGLLVVPVATSYVEQRTLASVREQAWATAQLATDEPYVVGIGRVTVTKHDAGVRPVRNLVAWVALAKRSDLSTCTAFTPPAPKARPPSGGWSAVVIGDASGSPAVVYASASIACNRLGRTTVEPATEVISAPWTLTARGVVATAPSCSTFTEVDYGSSPTSTSFRYLVTIPEGRASAAVPGSPALPSCRPANTTSAVALSGYPEARGVTATTVHAPTGLLRQVSTVPYQGPPTTSTTASTLAKYAHWAPPPGPGVLGYLPSSNGRVATVFSWSGRRLGRFHAPPGAQLLESDTASALSPSGRSVLVDHGFTVSAITVSGRRIGSFNANYGVLWGNDGVHVCALRLPSHLSATSTKATLVLADPGHGSRIVAQVPGTADHTNTWLVACDPAQHLAVLESSFMGIGIAVTDVNLTTGAQSAAPWYRPDRMGTFEISGDGRFAVTDAGLVVQTSTGRIVAHVAGEPVAISWLGHVVVTMADRFQNPQVVDWAIHRVLWRFRSHVGSCPCSSIWAIASSRRNSDDVAVNVPLRADRAVALWLIRLRGSALHLGSVAPEHP